MGSIYSHRVLNITADGFADGSHGLFRERNASLLSPIKLIIEEGVYMHIREGNIAPINHGEYLLVDVHPWRDEIDDAPLGRRGWVIQERALSLRTLHFGKIQVFWECMQLKANEIFSHGFVRGTVTNTLKFFNTPNTRENKQPLEIFRILKKTYGRQREPNFLPLEIPPLSHDYDHPNAIQHKARPHNDTLTLKEMGADWHDLDGLDPELLNELRLKDLESTKKN